jgi:hypothetical protein
MRQWQYRENFMGENHFVCFTYPHFRICSAMESYLVSPSIQTDDKWQIICLSFKAYVYKRSSNVLGQK